MSSSHTAAEWFGILNKNELAKPHIDYESKKAKKPADLEKTHISVILYYKIDHFCPLKSNFHHFLPVDPMFGFEIPYYPVIIICWYK